MFCIESVHNYLVMSKRIEEEEEKKKVLDDGSSESSDGEDYQVESAAQTSVEADVPTATTRDTIRQESVSHVSCEKCEVHLCLNKNRRCFCADHNMK